MDEAVEYCRKRGLEFYAVNKNYPEEEFDESISRKINADLFIDDRNLGGFPGWNVVFEMIKNDRIFEPFGDSIPNQRSFGQKLRGLFSND